MDLWLWLWVPVSGQLVTCKLPPIPAISAAYVPEELSTFDAPKTARERLSSVVDSSSWLGRRPLGAGWQAETEIVVCLYGTPLMSQQPTCALLYGMETRSVLPHAPRCALRMAEVK
ncbi:hypothetical protein BZA05DRAFT_421144 [Tricharina praecox]|uniref:uncharacterized protein n=1 Tax=Tricharina praecox TaxID=43433 RepID=UPI0022205922|nr:uncharacterized protein BZA05DRAFT_421144 [Tricharina praecox]KAI5846212.1 hypothetical protein BZA05DRAFT_421144 [Tricharina praecox]